jgi:hypothetical protein
VVHVTANARYAQRVRCNANQQVEVVAHGASAPAKSPEILRQHATNPALLASLSFLGLI